jgi:hypothetical protein
MHASRRALWWINILGGSAVLASYAHGIASNPLTRGEVWGGVPDSLRPVYTASMLLAAAGYFAFSHFVFFRLDPEKVRIGSRIGFGAFNVLYALILIPSALWMPLTFAMLEAPSDELWWTIRLTLGLVGVGSLGLLTALLRVHSPGATGARWVAVIGSVAFCFQTAILDALVWPYFFPA